MACQGCNREKKDFLSRIRQIGDCDWTPGTVTFRPIYHSKSEMKRIEIQENADNRAGKNSNTQGPSG